MLPLNSFSNFRIYMKLGYLPCYVGSSIFPFDVLFSESKAITRPEDVAECDAIILWGGEDIWAGYYKQEPHPRNQNRHGPTGRDVREWTVMKEALKLDIPIIGVCRGAQFLCAFAGGTLVQHMTGHHQTHDVMCELAEPLEGQNFKVYQTSSEHHQMMYVSEMPEDSYQVLAWAAGLSKLYEDDKGEMVPPEGGYMPEPEVVYFPKVRGFAIQGHPEWMDSSSPFVEWCFERISSLLLNKEQSCV